MSERVFTGLSLLAKLVVLVAFGTCLSSSASACCGVEPYKRVIQYLSCGSTEYDLGWTFKGVTYHTADYTVSGHCYVYTSCDCVYHNGEMIGYVTYVMQPFGRPNIIGYDVWWEATNYLPPQYSSCTSGSCAKTGVNAAFPTQMVSDIGYDTFYC